MFACTLLPLAAMAAASQANGAPHPPAEAYAKRFTGKYDYRLVSGSIGHNLPQEAPGGVRQGGGGCRSP